MKMLKFVLTQLTKPHPTIVNPINKKVAQFIAGYHLLTAPLAPLALSVARYSNPDFQPSFEWAIAVTSIALVNYFIARSRWFYFGFHLQIYSSFAIILYTTILIPERQSIHLCFLVPTLLAAMLVSFRSVLFIAGLTVCSLLALSLYLPPEYHQQLVGSTFVLLVLSGLVIVIRQHRNSLEDLRIKQIQIQKDKYLSLIDKTFDGTASLQQGKLQSVSAGFAAIFNLQPADMEGRPPSDIIPEALLVQSKQGVIQQKTITLPSNEQKHLQVVQEWHSSDEGIIAIRDITKIQEQQTQKVIMDRLMASGTLAAGVAHELNTPLMVAMNQTQKSIEEHNGKGPNNIYKRLLITQNVLEKIGLILNDLKWFIEQKESHVVNISQVIQNTIQLAKHRIQDQADILLQMNAEATINISESQLSQVMIILLLNAAESKKDNLERCTINVVTKEKENGMIEISVSDNGTGIPPGKLDRIFEPFFTTKQKGTGLGLAICQSLISKSNGTIAVESNLEEGSTFRIQIPTVARTKKPVKKVLQHLTPPQATILIVDDDPHLLEVIQEMLSPYNTHVAKNIETAIKAVSKRDFDCLICDVIMPSGGAIDLYESLLSSGNKIAQNFIFMTGGIVDQKVQRYIDNLQLPVLCKPFGQKELHETVLANLSKNHLLEPLPNK